MSLGGLGLAGHFSLGDFRRMEAGAGASEVFFSHMGWDG